MPSIRVRRSKYGALNDPPPEPSATFSRSLANIFGNSPTTQLQRPRAFSASEVDPSTLATPEQTATVPRSLPRSSLLRRPRAGSVVSQHVLNNSTRFSRSVASQSDRRTLRSLHQSPTHSPQLTGMIELEGDQADVMVPSDLQNGTVGSVLSLTRRHEEAAGGDEHHDEIVEHLDVIDPEVATVANLANAANAILIPPLFFYSRKPVLVLPGTTLQQLDQEGQHVHYDQLDRHVDDCLKRPSKFRRTMRGVWAFLKTPIGIITGIYGFLVVFWGAAIVLFLSKIINLHNPNTQGFWVEVSAQVTNGLFTATGIGLIPYRILDTYRIYKIWFYKHRIKQIRKEAGLPQLYDTDDLPDPLYDPNFVRVLTEQQQDDLHKQQVKLQHHQTWYRPHGTVTHRAFPINSALIICCLNDGNSIFQVALCGVMWGLNRFQRPPWVTALLIVCAFSCGILSAILIWHGGQKTKRTKEVKERLRAALAMDACEGTDAVAIRRALPRRDPPGDKSVTPQDGPAMDSGTITDEHMKEELPIHRAPEGLPEKRRSDDSHPRNHL